MQRTDADTIPLRPAFDHPTRNLIFGLQPNPWQILVRGCNRFRTRKHPIPERAIGTTEKELQFEPGIGNGFGG